MNDFENGILKQNIELKKNFSLSEHSSFKIGGAAKYAAFPDSEDKLISSIKLARACGIPFRVIGNTTNILFSDDGYDGLLIFTKKMSRIERCSDGNEATYFCECGVPLPKLSSVAMENSDSGFEFFCGIPGSVGGSVYMNAGAHGSELSDILISSRAYDTDSDKIINISSTEHDFSYRHSIYANRPQLVCLSAQFFVRRGDKEKIRELMCEYKSRRASTQPVAMASAGSYFKRPASDVFAPKLIQDCGLKGYRKGGVAISDKHAGFIVNLGGGTSADVLSLAEYVKDQVNKNTGIVLEPEVIYIDCKG